jgi:site-specific DNA recombinase
MTEAGYRTRRGKPFTDTTIDRLLRDPTAKGLRRSNYTAHDGGTRWGYKPEEEWVWTEVEPIMPAELWDECQAILDAQYRPHKKPSKKTVHLFAGLLYCQCGKRMYVPSRSDKYTCYSCRNKVAIDDLEHIFVEQLKGFLLSPDEVDAYVEEANQTLREREQSADALTAELQKVESQIDRLFALHNEGQLPTEGFNDRYQPLYDRQQALQQQLAEAQATLDILRVDTLTSEHILAEGQSLADRWPKLNRDEKRRLVEDLVEEITAGEEEVSFRLIYFPSTTTLQNVANGQRIHHASCSDTACPRLKAWAFRARSTASPRRWRG